MPLDPVMGVLLSILSLKIGVLDSDLNCVTIEHRVP
jgi:hypothetical protein